MAGKEPKTSTKKMLEQKSLLLERKLDHLKSLIATCNKSLEVFKKESAESLLLIRQRKDDQVKAIERQYEEMEARLSTSADIVTRELDTFIKTKMVEQKDSIKEAKKLLAETLEAPDQDIERVGDDMQTSLNTIINTDLPNLHLSQNLVVEVKDIQYREVELQLVDGPPPLPCTQESVTKPAGQGDFCDQDHLDSSHMSDTIARADAVRPGTSSDADAGDIAAAITEPSSDQLKSDPKKPPAEKSVSTTSDCPMVSFSKSVSQVQIPGFTTHIAHSGTNTFVVDSFAPAIYKIGQDDEIKRLLTVESSQAVVGLAASADYLYVQFMDVTEYQRTVHVYTAKDGQFIKQWETPNLLGASIALVNYHLVISSRDKVMVCSPTGKHIKDIAVSPRCVKTINTLDSESVVLCSTSANLVMRLNVEKEEVSWRNYTLHSPICAAADTFGRVYALVQPSTIYVLDAKTGDLLMQSTLSCAGGLMETLCLTNGGLLLTAISYRGSNSDKPGCYSVLNRFCIEGVV